ncbi:MAG: hypothetical protein ACYDBY_20565 [Thermoanaerobaculia bacterium]
MGCLSASLAGSVAFVAVAGGAALALRPLSGDGELWIWAAVAAGGCALAAVVALVQIPDAQREMRMLRDAASGVPPADGAEGVFTGTIRSGGPLLAPFSGEPVAAYTYTVCQQTGSVISSTLSTFYSGSASAPLVLETTSGPLPFLAFPAILDAGREVPRPVARPAFESYAARTTYARTETPSGPAREGRNGTAEHRADWAHWEDEPFWPRTSYFEALLRDGEPVTVRGVYRAELGIAADPATGTAPLLFRGDLPSALRRSRARFRSILVGAVLFALLAAATVAAGRIWLESRGGGGMGGQACNRVLFPQIHDCTPDPIGSDPIGRGRTGGAPRGAFA